MRPAPYHVKRCRGYLVLFTQAILYCKSCVALVHDVSKGAPESLSTSGYSSEEFFSFEKKSIRSNPTWESGQVNDPINKGRRAGHLGAAQVQAKQRWKY